MPHPPILCVPAAVAYWQPGSGCSPRVVRTRSGCGDLAQSGELAGCKQSHQSLAYPRRCVDRSGRGRGLTFKAGHAAEFESTFSRAKQIISSMPGFRRLSLSRCLERADSYLLLVEWDTLEDHTEGFRGSAEYQEWRTMLHRYYDPFPVVEHYEQVDGA